MWPWPFTSKGSFQLQRLKYILAGPSSRPSLVALSPAMTQKSCSEVSIVTIFCFVQGFNQELSDALDTARADCQTLGTR